MGVSYISNMEFQKDLNEDVTNITKPPPRELVTLITWNYFDQNEGNINVTNLFPRGLVTLVTCNFLKISMSMLII
jgi:hypothetical protein